MPHQIFKIVHQGAHMTPLKIFVAMPGTTMGDGATYENPEAVNLNYSP